MARIRTIKPDAFLSESLSSVPRGARWTFAGLWTYLDDEGRGRSDARLIHAALYAIDDTTTVEDVANDLDAIESIGSVCRYEVAGRSYIHATRWHHQKINRPTESRIPPCPIHEDSLNPHGALSESSVLEKEKEQGKGTGNREQGSPTANAVGTHSATPVGFDNFWDAYPRKDGKAKAEKAYRTACREVSSRVLFLAAIELAKWHQIEGTDTKFIPHAATWLNGKRWTDERPPPKSSTRGSTTDQRVGDGISLVNQLKAEEENQQKAIGQ